MKKKLGYMLSGLWILILLTGCGQTTQKNPADMLNEAADACYKIEAFDDTGQCIAVGSGFSMYEEDLLFTCWHTVEGSACINAVNDDGEVLVADQILAKDEDHDLVIYSLPEAADGKKNLSSSLLTPERELPQRGERVYTVASFGGITNTVSDGMASGTWEEGGTDYLLFTAPIAPGCSGGALLDAEGRVVGLICKAYEEGQSMNFSVPISYAMDLYQSVK